MFQDLKIIKGSKRDNSKYSFVGIQRDEQTNKLEFWLPHGFDNFPENDFDSKKKLFFRMYKTFKKFRNENRIFLKNYKTDDRDGVSTGSGGFIFKDREDEEIILYSKLVMLDNILDSYDELKITALLNKNSRSEHIDYSKIDQYMHKAIYLPNDVIYIDEMLIPRKIMVYSHTDLIEMYSFIYVDVKESLDEEKEVDSKIKLLAQNFKEKYLTPESSLFEEETYEKTINTLKEVLSEIDRNTAYKDDDYWHFFDAIETFLYGTKIHGDEDEGSFWGVNNFAFIWEAMCHHYMFNQQEFKDDILYADSEVYGNTEIEGNKIFLGKDFQSPVFFELNEDKSKRRYLRPDLVYNLKDEKNNDFFDDIFKEVEIKESKFFPNLFEITIENIIKIRYDLKKHGFEEESDFFKNQIFVKKTKIGGSRQRDIFYITKKNYYAIITDIKEKISDKIDKVKTQNSLFRILDYKYHPLMLLDKSFNALKRQMPSSKNADDTINKIKADIKKKLIYEYAIQLQYETAKTQSKFWIPYYFINSEEVGIGESHKNLGKEIKESKIDIFKANFMLIQEKYLEK